MRPISFKPLPDIHRFLRAGMALSMKVSLSGRDPCEGNAYQQIISSPQGSAKPKLQTKLKNGPNQWQTWGQFLYRLSTILDVQNTAFIVPVEDDYGETTGVYPILPSLCEIKDYGGEPWLAYTFQSGNTAVVEMSRCGIMTKFQYSDDFFGESNAHWHRRWSWLTFKIKGYKSGKKLGNLPVHGAG